MESDFWRLQDQGDARSISFLLGDPDALPGFLWERRLFTP